MPFDNFGKIASSENGGMVSPHMEAAAELRFPKPNARPVLENQHLIM